MPGTGGLIAVPLQASGSFNWVFLVEYIVTGILALFFLFYFNRLFATLISYFITLYTWHAYRVYIEIEALQISLLAGRIFFKGIRYHGDNETILVHNGYITWRYWLRTVKNAEIFDQHDASQARSNTSTPSPDPDAGGECSDENASGVAEAKQPPCRIAIRVSGVEAFLYNRGPAYDMIVDLAGKDKTPNQFAEAQTKLTQQSEKHGYQDLAADADTAPSSIAHEIASDLAQRKFSLTQDQSLPPLSNQNTRRTTTTHGTSTSILSAVSDRFPPPPSFLRLFPIYVECNTGAAVVGNENTKAIITAKFTSAEGEFDASRASSVLDLFKILIKFKVEQPYVQMKPNIDFVEPQLAEAAMLKAESGHGSDAESAEFVKETAETKRSSLWSRITHWLTRAGRRVNPLRRRSSFDSIATKSGQSAKTSKYVRFAADLPGQDRWLGLTRYLADNQLDEHDEWEAVEYAKSSLLADIKSVSLNFYWDIPGVVPETTTHTHQDDEEINGSSPPDYGLELAVRGGQINYGPWADRHRVVLQQIFFPAPFFDAIAAEKLRQGDTRIPTIFNLKLSIDEDTILRVPFREASKDWRWKGRAAAMLNKGRRPQAKAKGKGRSRRHGRKRDMGNLGVDLRPFAWFDIRVNEKSSVSYCMDMMPGRKGYKNRLDVDVSGINISSSLNHGLLWRSGKVSMSCDLSNILVWNGLREWLFDINIKDLDLFLLRDHTFMMVDLIQDWTAGPPPDFHTFIPFIYLMNVKFDTFRLFLNTNDANIVDNPDDPDDNNFIILYGDKLNAELVIPLERFRPSESDISFKADAFDLGFEMSTPARNTLHTLLQDKNVAQLRSVHLDGTYTACTEVAPGLTETLNLDIVGKGLNIAFYGFLARQLVRLKENYFGDDVHFRTLEEYQKTSKGADSHLTGAPSLKSNDLDVILNIAAEDLNVLLPSGMYNVDEHVRVKVNAADIDLRVTNYYLEMNVNSNPLELDFTTRATNQSPRQSETSGTQLFVDGLRVFGHRLFGLPPAEPAYVSNWDIDAGIITGECNTDFVEHLIGAVQGILLTVSDNENAMPIPPSIIWHDSTFVRFNTDIIKIWFTVDDEALLISTEKVKGTFNDLARSLFSQHLDLVVQDFCIACADSKPTPDHSRVGHRVMNTHALIQTTVSMVMVKRDLHFSEQRKLQQDHMLRHDVRAARADFLLGKDHQSRLGLRQTSSDGPGIVSLPLPSLPDPLEAKHRARRRLLSKHNSSSTANAVEVDRAKNTRARPSSIASLSGSPAASTVSRGSTRPGSIKRSVNSTHIDLNTSHHLASASQQDGHQSLHDVVEVRNDDATDSAAVGPRKLSIVALSSPFKLPYIPLNAVQLDTSDIPTLPEPDQDRANEADRSSVHGDVSTGNLAEDAVQTSIVLAMKSGIVAYCKPKAVETVARLIRNLTPKTPETILDHFQFSVVNEVLSSHTRKSGDNSITDIAIRIPAMHLRFVNDSRDESSTEDDQNSTTNSDRYNLIATDMALAVRIKVVPNRRHEEDLTSFHGTVGSLRVLALDGFKKHRGDHAAFQASVDNILIWLVRSERTSVHTTFNVAEVSLSSKQVDYLASLVYRTAMLADNFQTLFSVIPKEQELRLQFLVDKLVRERAEHPDPAFLTRPTNVLRSFADHIRNSDSWKMISRLRYVYQCMSAEEKAELSESMRTGPLTLPHDSQHRVLEVLDQWRSWEGIQIKESFAIRMLYGSSKDIEQMHNRTSVPISAMIKGSALRVHADPGNKQNGIFLDGLVLGLTATPPPPPSDGASLFDTYKDIKSTVIQVSTSEIALRVNWEICELIDSMLSLFEQSKADNDAHDSDELARVRSQIRVDPERFHIIFAATKGSINLETIHLRSVIASEALMVTVTGFGWNAAEVETDVNVLVSSSSSSADFYSDDRVISTAKVVDSRIWLGYERSMHDLAVTESLKLVGSGAEIIFKLEEETLGLISLVQSVINDEVRFINKLMLDHPSTVPPALQEHPEVRQDPIKVNLALLLDGYDLDLAVLHNLRYRATGKVLRLAITPDTLLGGAYQIDFDLKAQTHRLIHRAQRNDLEEANFDIAPINGTIRLLLTHSLATASAVVTVEHIALEGQAVYGALSMLSSISAVAELEEIKSEVQELVRAVQIIFPPKKPAARSETDKAARTVIFDSNLVLAGFSILAQTPDSTAAQKASLELYLSSTQVRVSNRSPSGDTALPFPEIKVDLGELGAELTQIHHGKKRLRGRAILGALFTCTLSQLESKKVRRDFKLSVVGPQVDLFAGTAPALVHILSFLQNRMHNLDLTKEKKYIKKLRRLESSARPPPARSDSRASAESSGSDEEESGFISTFTYDMNSTRISYNVGEVMHAGKARTAEDLVLTLQSIQLLTRSEAEARLLIKNLQVEFKHKTAEVDGRSPNSALLPEIIINAGHKMIKKSRKLVIRAAGKALDLQLDPYIAIPASDLQHSIHKSSEAAQAAATSLKARPASTEAPASKSLLSGMQLSSLLLVAEFAGAVVNLQGRSKEDLRKPTLAALHLDHAPSHGRYGQFTAEDSTTSATLRAPGIATKVQYEASKTEQNNLNVEFRIDASENVLYPSVVPLILQISESISMVLRDVEGESKKQDDVKKVPKKVTNETTPSVKTSEESPLEIANPSAILGKTKLNFGFRICSQKFSLSCQPIAKVAATAELEDIYITINTVESPENGNFFAASIAFTGPSVNIQHAYSREPTFRFANESIILSLMNSKHISGTSGLSAILRLNPTSTQINVKQFQDILLFREIWMPPEIRNASKAFAATSSANPEPQEYFVQRYQQVAAAAAFPWNATLAIEQISIEVDLGQSIGKSSFQIKKLWASSKKSTSSQQTLCLGIEALGMSSTGRMSGFIELDGVKARTSIAWPEADAGSQKPLIQGSMGFDQLRVKAAFDYQTFAIVHITAFEFIMYNVRDSRKAGGDRLVAILDGDQVCVFCVATAPALAVSLYQAFDRLIQEKKDSYDDALGDIEKFLRRKSSIFPGRSRTKSMSTGSTSNAKSEHQDDDTSSKMPISLHTDVVVTLRSVRLGAFPSTLLDHQVLEVEASNIEARFAVALEDNKIHSGLGLTLGQLHVALAQVPRPKMPEKLGEIEIEDVVKNAKAASGGIILRVPRVALRMQSWQAPGSKFVDYLFRCSFEGKIDVGWNYSRISFIRGMWNTHTRTLATRLGKPLPQPAVRISAGSHGKEVEKKEGGGSDEGRERQKITAVVSLPQSQNIYRPLEPPVIDTPQLRDMGEATPPLEWIGLQRDRLPGVTHQIIITTLLEVAKEVEDAYSRVLGTV